MSKMIKLVGFIGNNKKKSKEQNLHLQVPVPPLVNNMFNST